MLTYATKLLYIFLLFPSKTFVFVFLFNVDCYVMLKTDRNVFRFYKTFTKNSSSNVKKERNVGVTSDEAEIKTLCVISKAVQHCTVDIVGTFY